MIWKNFQKNYQNPGTISPASGSRLRCRGCFLRIFGKSMVLRCKIKKLVISYRLTR